MTRFSTGLAAGCLALTAGFSDPATAAIADKLHLTVNIAPRLPPSRDNGRNLASPVVDDSRASRFSNVALPDRLHHFSLRGGPHALTFDAGRGWGRIDGAAGMRSIGQPASFGAASLSYSFDVGDADSIRLTATGASERRNPGLAATEYRPNKSTNSSLTLGWQHDTRWRLEGGLFSIKSSSHGAAEGSAIAMMGGTAPSEHGPQLMASYAADERSPWHAVRLGLSLGDMTLDGPTTARLDPAQRRDRRAVVAIRFRFR